MSGQACSRQSSRKLDLVRLEIGFPKVETVRREGSLGLFVQLFSSHLLSSLNAILSFFVHLKKAKLKKMSGPKCVSISFKLCCLSNGFMLCKTHFTNVFRVIFISRLPVMSTSSEIMSLFCTSFACLILSKHSFQKPQSAQS